VASDEGVEVQMPLHRLVVRVWPLFFVLVLTPMAVLAQNQPPPPAVQKEQLLKPAQLDALVANIALYPDNVLSSVLMASTYPLDVVMADRWVKENKGLRGDQLKAEMEKQSWDDSVKSLAARPDVLSMMNARMDWTQKLGDAVLNQQTDVMDAIQRLRTKTGTGNKSTSIKQPRITGNALVIGNAAYKSVAALKTPITDASIVAETLLAAGYEVTELHDIGKANIGPSMRDFLDKVSAGGPDAVAIFYYSGYATQTNGENFLVPVDATINEESDVAREAFRLRDFINALAKTPLAARIIILDASRDHQFGQASSKPVAKGLAAQDMISGTLVAFAAAPGAVSIDSSENHSLYTETLVATMRQRGLDLEQIFKKTRLQISKKTSQAQIPWTISALDVELHLFGAANQQVSQNDSEPKRPRSKKTRNHPIPIGVIRDFIRHAPF
jgi:hypothetical protein